MRRMMMRGLLLVWVVALSLSYASPLAVEAGKLGPPEGDFEPGVWYVGEAPAQPREGGPILLFVHGMNSTSQTWWYGNDMAEVARTQGYQTVFIDLHPDQDMWKNGQLLARKLPEIQRYFSQPLVVIAHSKGGVDTQAALIHYGASPYVEHVITLGSPHHGSPLADLAYSRWAGWLAGILGSKNGATYSLQTAYMERFRQETDRHPLHRANAYYTLAGTGRGPFGSSLYWGGLYLLSYGPNDGAVVVEHARLPYAPMLRIDRWHHGAIKTGSTFPYFQSRLGAMQAGDEMEKEEQRMGSKGVSPLTGEYITASSYLHGGLWAEGGKEVVWVEEDVEALVVDVMSATALSSLQLISPTGQSLQPERYQEEEGIWQGAWHHVWQVPTPASGAWDVLAPDSIHEGAPYLLQAHYRGGVSSQLQLAVERKGEELVLTPSGQQNWQELTTAYSLRFIDEMGQEQELIEEEPLSMQRGTLSLPTDFTRAGIYNLTLDLRGITDEGHRFNRTIVTTWLQ